MIIDAHTHGIHGRYLDQLADAGGDWARKRVARMRERARERPQWIDVDRRVQLLDKYGFDLQVVSSVPVMDSNIFPGDAQAQLVYARALNDSMARMMEDSKGRVTYDRHGPAGRLRARRPAGDGASRQESRPKGGKPSFQHKRKAPGAAAEFEPSGPMLLRWTFPFISIP